MSPQLRHRHPIAAVALSLMSPGLGQLYAGAPKAALVAFLAPYPLLALIIAAVLLHLPAAVFWLAVLLVAVCIVAVIINAGICATRAPKPYEARWYNRWWLYVATILFFAFIWGPGIQRAVRSVVRAYRIPSSAMEPNILVGDFIYADQRSSARAPRLNDVIVYRSVTQAGVSIIKRVVGLPGDTLQSIGGRLQRNGGFVSEPWIRELRSTDTMSVGDSSGNPVEQENARRGWTMLNWGPIVVPEHSLFVMGDNRPNSYDSRFYGSIPSDHVTGKPAYLYLSLDPEYHFAVRWSRLGRMPWLVQPN